MFVSHKTAGYKFAAWLYLFLSAAYITIFAILESHIDTEYFLLVFMSLEFILFDSAIELTIVGLVNFGLFVFIRFFQNNVIINSSTLPQTPVNPNQILIFTSIAIVILFIKSKLSEIEQKNREQNITIEKNIKELELQKQMVATLYNKFIDSISYAQRLQFSFFPDKKCLTEKLKQYGLIFLPKEGLSGNFYMLNSWGYDDIIIVGDTTINGISGSLLSIIFMSFIRELAERAYDQGWHLTDILNNLRNKIRANLKYYSQHGQEGINIALLHLSENRTKFTFAGANIEMYLIRSGVMYIFKGVRAAVASYLREIEFEQEEFELQQGDRIIMFTDGFIDQIGAQGRRLSPAKFRKLILDTCEMKPSEQSQALLDFFYKWKGDSPQTDDVTVLIFDA